MSVAPTEGDSRGTPPFASSNASLLQLLNGHPAAPEATIVHAAAASLTTGELKAAVQRVAGALAEAGVGQGNTVGGLVGSGPSGVVYMFAVWSVGAVYLPINRRGTAHEVAALIAETTV